MTSAHRNDPEAPATDGADHPAPGRGVGLGAGLAALGRRVGRLTRAGRTRGGGSRGPRSPWRFATPLVVLASGALFAVSGTNSEGTDLRPGRYTTLGDLTEAESRAYRGLEDEAASLEQQVDGLTRDVDDAQVRRLERRAARLKSLAGLDPVEGEGLRVVLSDAPPERFEDDVPSAERNLLVVHQEDLQELVNALWAGGATAVSLEGERVVTTTGIKCAASLVRINGAVYPQPYVVEAIGDPAALSAAVDASDRMIGFRADAADPAIGVGFEMESSDALEVPGYDKVFDLYAAEPQDQPSS